MSFFSKLNTNNK